MPRKSLPRHGMVALFCTLWLMFSCDLQEKKPDWDALVQSEMPVHYAKGFRIYSFAEGYVLWVSESGKESDRGNWIGLTRDERSMAALQNVFRKSARRELDACIQVPVKRLVSNSTTHVAALDRIGALDHLVGFAHLDLISTPAARRSIEAGTLEELGLSGTFDPERLLQIRPDLVLSFEVKGEARAMSQARNAGIAVLPIGEWLEQTPLGRAEWLRVFGLLTGKEERSAAVFDTLEQQYLNIRRQAAGTGKSPLVLSGSLFKDTYYAPGSENWMAELIRDAGGSYLWDAHSGSGSLHLSVEEVLRQGSRASLWIGSGQFGSLGELRASHPLIAELPCVVDEKVYGYMNARGETGGVLFFEEAAFYPDRLISDVFHILEHETAGAPLSDLHYFAPLRP